MLGVNNFGIISSIINSWVVDNFVGERPSSFAPLSHFVVISNWWIWFWVWSDPVQDRVIINWVISVTLRPVHWPMSSGWSNVVWHRSKEWYVLELRVWLLYSKMGLNEVVVMVWMMVVMVMLHSINSCYESKQNKFHV